MNAVHSERRAIGALSKNICKSKQIQERADQAAMQKKNESVASSDINYNNVCSVVIERIHVGWRFA